MKKDKTSAKNKRPRSTVALYSAATIVALIAIAYLTNNLLLFKDTLNHYIAQGYTTSEVIKGLLPNQLLPGIFEPVALYGGVAALLFAAGSLHARISHVLTTISRDHVENSTPDIIPGIEAEPTESVSEDQTRNS